MSVTDRRPMGALEADVLRHLWNSSEPATPGQVHEALGADIAYTTVMTVLTRLWRKGLVDREQRGRAYAYHPLVSEADYAAKRMRDALGGAQNREAVLGRFVDTLSARDAKVLRRVLDGLDGKK
jgi:predicted transcriptional regulator